MNFDNSKKELEILRNKLTQPSDIFVPRKEGEKFKRNISDSVWESDTYNYLMK